MRAGDWRGSHNLTHGRTAEERFWMKVIGGDYEHCWLWTGARIRGYGYFTPATKRTVIAHRWSYEHMIGEIPPGLELDHLCHHRPCVNPYHLEPVTHQENLLRRRGRGKIVGGISDADRFQAALAAGTAA